MALKDVKKMCSNFCNGKSSDIVGYTPPTLHKGVCYCIINEGEKQITYSPILCVESK